MGASFCSRFPCVGENREQKLAPTEGWMRELLFVL